MGGGGGGLAAPQEQSKHCVMETSPLFPGITRKIEKCSYKAFISKCLCPPPAHMHNVNYNVT